MPYYIIAIIIVIIDQLSKLAVVNFMDNKGINTIPLWEGVFHLTSHRNAGAAFGILQNQRWFFISVTIIVIATVIYIIYKYEGHSDKKLMLYGIALLLGGAIGNLIDRIFIGQVIDFFDFRLINFAIFNIADSAIVIGVGLLFLDTWLTYQEDKKKENINESRS
ncbi:signal peptidase II [Desulfuribacillus stibiiarsenatis]|uniref:Lipoprotein signal peptidase n=1 Tax=Desulfuribacillus stibiiarsenatis TaxID=1390249 RepID=A0A1E5L460_9FIRM|nr:signal peptidase II [Desulfuribacillus stibiiarsenatis]OEH84729.1 signal peptidase II [Desulfuribacillus stibiiarsenatis]